MKEGRLVAGLGMHHGKCREWTKADVSPVQDAGERVWDAVQRARAEEALRENEEQLHPGVRRSSLSLRRPRLS